MTATAGPSRSLVEIRRLRHLLQVHAVQRDDGHQRKCADNELLVDFAEESTARLLDIASGTLTFGEIVGEGGEVVSRIGPSM